MSVRRRIALFSVLALIALPIFFFAPQAVKSNTFQTVNAIISGFSLTSPLPVFVQNTTPIPVTTAPPGVNIQNTTPIPVTTAPPGVNIQNTTPIPVTTAPPAATPIPYPTLAGVLAVAPTALPTLSASTVYGSATGLIAPHVCDKFFSVNITSATTTQLVALASGKKIYLCEASVVSTGTNATDFVSIEYGTKVSTDCDTGATTYAAPISQNGAANGALNRNTGVIIPTVPFGLLFAPASNEACAVTTGATVALTVFGWYAQDTN